MVGLGGGGKGRGGEGAINYQTIINKSVYDYFCYQILHPIQCIMDCMIIYFLIFTQKVGCVFPKLPILLLLFQAINFTFLNSSL